jgi:hypothetical protein
MWQSERVGGSGVEASAGAKPADAVRSAVLHYVRELKRGRAVPFPRFGRGSDHASTLAGIDLDLDGDTASELEREAERQHVRIEQLLAHAMFVYLADVDSAYA